MSLAQLHYTSLPPGPDGSGFRFTAVSPGIPGALLREAEQLIGYEPPRSAPPRPGPEELRAFPTAFSLNLLSDGGRLLSRTVYTGEDYSGRWGNFHAHAVYLPAGTGLPADRLPITAWESPRWARHAPAATEPEPLDALPTDGSFDEAAMIGFALSRGPGLAAFFTDLRRLAEDEHAPHLVMVEESSQFVARWIALAGTVLPRPLAQRLTFTTYTRRPQQARQQIVGVLPETAAELSTTDHRYRLHDPARPDDGRRETDPWAEVAAYVWQTGAPTVFRAVQDDPPFDAGALSVAVCVAGHEPPPAVRAAALDWMCAHPRELEGEDLVRLTRTLCTRPPQTEREATALHQLHTALDGHAPLDVTAPVAAALVTATVRGVNWPGPVPPASGLTPGLKSRLAGQLGAELCAAAADPALPPLRALALVQIGTDLGVDCSPVLGPLAARLAPALLDEATGTALPDTDVLEDLSELRTALLPHLERLAADAPVAVAGLLSRVVLPLDAESPVPHLRMCAEAESVLAMGGDRNTAWSALLRRTDPSYTTHPLLLRTAQRLVWRERRPSAHEMLLLLQTAGADAHGAAGTWEEAVEVALRAPAEDPHALELAPVLLRCFPDRLPPRVRAALMLLELAHDIKDGTATDWAGRASALRDAAEPVEPALLRRVHTVLAQALLDGAGTPEGELYALVHSRDEDLVSAYGAAARTEPFRDVLRTSPRTVAHCFVDWSAHSEGSAAWRRTGAALLDEVLRPVVRALPAEQVNRAEQHLERAGSGHADAFREWNRPGALTRLGRRLTGGRGRKDIDGGRGRGEADGGHRLADVEQGEKGRRW